MSHRAEAEAAAKAEVKEAAVVEKLKENLLHNMLLNGRAEAAAAAESNRLQQQVRLERER